MSPVTRIAWWWLRSRGWAVQVNTPDTFDPVHGWRPLFMVRYGLTPVYRVGPHRFDRATLQRWASVPGGSERRSW